MSTPRRGNEGRTQALAGPTPEPDAPDPLRMHQLRPSLGLAPLALLLCGAAARPEPPAGPPAAAARLAGAAGPIGALDRGAAAQTAALLDLAPRAPGGAGYEAAVLEVERALRAAGFGALPGLELEALEIAVEEGWEATRGELALLDGDRRLSLHRFERPWDADRALVPRNAPPADVTGPAVFELDDVRPGSVLVTAARVRPDVLRRAHRRGAVAVLSASLGPHSVGPAGEPLVDAIEVRELPADVGLPVMQITQRSYDLIRGSAAPRVALRAEARRTAPSARGLVARVAGSAGSREAVVLTAHLQGSCASDDVGGVAALLEAARAAARAAAQDPALRPRRSLVFLFGPDLQQVRRWLAASELEPVGALTLLGVGSGPELVLERAPDLDASPERFPPVRPSALSAAVRVALAELGAPFEEQAWEGGSEADAFLAAGVPAVLLWSRPGAVTRTSLDRVDALDLDAVVRAGDAALRAAWTLAALEPGDVDRVLVELERERRDRVACSLALGAPRRAAAWAEWLAAAASELAAPPR